MVRRKIGIVVAAASLAAGLGVASALADTTPAPGTPTATPVVQGVDEQGVVNDVAAAADDVQTEVDSTAADDQSGDQQGADDQSEEQGDQQDGQQGAANADDQGGDQQGANAQSATASDSSQSEQDG